LGPLGPARDLDVFATETILPVAAARPGDPDLATLIELVADSRWRAHRTVHETLAAERYGDLAFGLACWVARRGWRQGADVDVLLAQRQPVRDFATGMLDRRHRQVRKRGRGFAELSAEARHDLRIALKKLRYGTEFFAALYPARETERFRKAAARMQDILGHLNDVTVAQHVLKDLLDATEPGSRQRSAALAAGQVIGWYGRQAQDLEPQAVAAWEELRGAAPFWAEEG
jgi:triphosphatase